MSRPFRRDGEQIVVSLSAPERAAIAALPEVIEAAGDADGRFAYQAHPDDPGAARRYQELVGEDLASLRAADRAAFAAALGADSLDVELAEAFMRVVGEARIVLASRLGIEEDGWEESASIDDPEIAMLHYLGFLQNALVEVLSNPE